MSTRTQAHDRHRKVGETGGEEGKREEFPGVDASERYSDLISLGRSVSGEGHDVRGGLPLAVHIPPDLTPG